ncbi:killer cell lectin-like receptor subfamily B member 1B allele B [Onychostruthus taczanowskii]|uniref:killer cell lectin-like receptor subfamily B member 1B allele B n=1 Tax=Onychostruthus taczanowskii TaxID=356909 RepID=UPI001B7FF124|nr:killer cell lectin-like receptor subfamily B member 1B allele B [Onychostruthus taczanowskii]
MEDEDGYVILERGDKRGSAGRSPPREGAGSSRCPRRLLVALTAALALSLVLCLSWCVAQQWQSQGTAGYESASPGAARSSWDGILREMRRVLCPPRESEGCRLCAVGWRLLGAKCYWISDGMNPWNRSREDCRDRGSALLVPWDQDELVKGVMELGMWDMAAPGGLVLPKGLEAPMEGAITSPFPGQEFLNESLRNPTRHFWIGLSVPAAGTGWTWENGSELDQDRFQLDLEKRPGACGTLKGNGIRPQSCDTRLQWICQKESVLI